MGAEYLGPELVKLAGEEKVLKEARKLLKAGELEQAMMMTEVAIEADPNSKAALQVQLNVLEALLARAESTYNTFSEVAWLQLQISKVSKKLKNT